MRLASCLVVVVWAMAGVAHGDEPNVPASKPLELTEGWGTIEGRFILEGDVPFPPRPLVPGGIPAVPDERLLIDRETKGIANIVIFLRKAPSAVHPELKKSKVAVIEFKADQFRFKPHVLHLRTDQQVRCGSVDGRVYNVNVAPFRNNGFNLLVGGQSGDHPFAMNLSESVPISVTSDIHSWMRAHWIVTDHPYVGITDENGRFRIEGLPAGEHAFTVWHEQVGWIDRKWTIEVRSKESRSLPAVKVPLSKFRTRN